MACCTSEFEHNPSLAEYKSIPEVVAVYKYGIVAIGVELLILPVSGRKEAASTIYILDHVEQPLSSILVFSSGQLG